MIKIKGDPTEKPLSQTQKSNKKPKKMIEIGHKRKSNQDSLVTRSNNYNDEEKQKSKFEASRRQSSIICTTENRQRTLLFKYFSNNP